MGVPVKLGAGGSRGDRRARPQRPGARVAAGIRRRRARSRRRPDGVELWTSASKAGRRSSSARPRGSGSHRPRHSRRRARTWSCSRAPQGAAPARGRAHRRGCGGGDVREPAHLERAVADGSRHVRRHRHPRPEQRRPAAARRRSRSMRSRSRRRSSCSCSPVVRLVQLALPHRARERPGPDRSDQLARRARALAPPRRSRTRYGRASSAI